MNIITILLIILFIVFLHIVVERTVFTDLRKSYMQNHQSREILELIKTNNPSCEEPIFNHDIQPDFSGYCE